MMRNYDPSKIEPKWIKRWEEQKLYKTPKPSAEKPKLYCLDMFPYPSGDGLHVGHARIYTASDVLARYFRARGYSVLHPMGWDAFGLPAENDAIRNKQNPNKRVPGNITTFRRQMQILGFSYDWGREFATCDPAYYKWTQWLFLKLYEKGLAYQSIVPINWCPSCKTGLADEEAVGGKCDRCGAAVTKKDMKQWLLRITGYADRLLYDLDNKDLDWPEGIVKMQKDWIGRSEGVTIDFAIKDNDGLKITTFTTRADTIFGVTAMVLAPEHPIVASLLSSKLKAQSSKLDDIKGYVERSKAKSELERTDLAKEKTGVFTGLYAINPLSNEEVPVWVGDYVIGTYGGGAVMVVPAHDRRDCEFAKKYGLEIRKVISGGNISEPVFEGYGLLVNSGEFSGLQSEKAIAKIAVWLEKRGLGKRTVNYKMRDWVFSRQRYWGEPFPLIHCEKCGVVPIPYEDLPVELPYLESYEPTGTGESPLSAVEEWVNVKCPKCGGPAERETDTMPNWAGSCWYFLRFADSHNDQLSFSKEAMKKWLPVDWYLGGAEHAVLHLLYARFWVKVFQDLGLLDFGEPFLRLRGVGMVLAEDGRKMSKSWRNVINPDDVVEAFGADTLRMYEMFMGPWGQAIAWNPQGVEGCFRFLKKVWRLVGESDKSSASRSSEGLRRHLHRLVKKVGEDIEAMKFNTAVAAFMEFMNEWSDEGQKLAKADIKVFLRTLAPFAPFICEEMWANLGENPSIHLQSWPKYDKSLLREETVSLVVQVNGKVRGKLDVPAEISEKEVLSRVGELENVKKYLEGKKIKKTIFVKGRLVNFVI